MMSDSSASYQKVNRRDSERSRSQHSLYTDSSDESIPQEAPLARQPRCSIDIDTIEPIAKPIRKSGGIERENAYLDSTQLIDSTQEIS